MSLGFGFSAENFIRALELVATVVNALRSSGNASVKYRELLRQLFNLETALLQVKRLDFNDKQCNEYNSLHQAASDCQLTIDEFWKKIQKYHGPLQSGAHSSRLKTAWMKVRWAVCKEDDVKKFQAALLGHTEAIQLLLGIIQMQRTTLSDYDRDRQHKSIISQVQEAYFKSIQRLLTVEDGISRNNFHGKQLLEMSSEVMRRNVQIFQVVLNIQNILTRIPGQMERQQPVYLIDALGKASPFHLEFIRSAEALLAVLKVNFKKIGRAAEKIERGEFAINDASTKYDIDLKTDWDVCFFPGQRVEMSMVFNQEKNTGSHCPKCQEMCDSLSGLDVECLRGGMIFRRISELDDLGEAQEEEPLNSCNQGELLSSHATNSRKRKHSDGRSEEELDLALFRRVRIRASSHSVAEEPRIERRPIKTVARKSTGGMAPPKRYDSKAALKGTPIKGTRRSLRK